MKNLSRSGLLPIIALGILLLIVITVAPSSILRAVIGLPFLFYLTGYTLITMLYPRKDSLGKFDRVALSFGFSIVVVALVGIVLNYTPLGIRLYPVLVSLIVFTIVTALVAWYREGKIPIEERVILSIPIAKLTGHGEGTLSRAVSIGLIVAVLVTMGTLVYAITTPKVGEKYTEFYILGAENKAAGYPRQLSVSQEGSVTIGIANREQETVTYSVVVKLNSVDQGHIGPVILQMDEVWEGPVTFKATQTGDNQKVEFIIYRDEQTEPYLKPLFIWINVQ